MLVYGPSAVFGPRRRRSLKEEIERSHAGQATDPGIVRVNRETGTDTTTEVLFDAWFGQYIPLEQHGLLRRSERVRSRRWEVYITIGEK
jgi:hypothetical protein